jgi:hypothetical protein
MKEATIDVGIVHSMMVPREWKTLTPEPASPWACFKARTDWHDCTGMIEVTQPQAISTLDSAALRKVMNESETPSPATLTAEQFNQLPDLKTIHQTGALTTCSTIRKINGRPTLVIEHYGKITGPHEFIDKSRHRSPLLQTVHGVVYVPITAGTIQGIFFHADTMDDAHTCMTLINEILNTIRWSRQ